MTLDDPNLEMVEFIAAALGPLSNELVFVGGCAAGLLITDPGRAAIRATNDVDLIAEVAGYGEYYPLTERLREAGFSEDPNEGPVCRWLYQGVKVDVMPTDAAILGFTNRWYKHAVESANVFQLPGGGKIRLITPPLLVATKIEAFHNRGEGDYQASHDLEDIISVVDGRPELIEEIAMGHDDVKTYLAEEVEDLLALTAFTESIPYHLAPGQSSQNRVPIILERLRGIAGL